MSYDGPDRRREHCEMHQENTKTLNDCATQISAIKSSMFTARWIIGLLIGVCVLVIGTTLTDIKAAIGEVRQDVKVILPIEARIDRIEKTVDYNSGRISEIERKAHEHSH